LLKKETLAAQLGLAKVNAETIHSWEATLSAIGSAHDILCRAKRDLKQLIEDVKQEERRALAEINSTAKQLEFASQELLLSGRVFLRRSRALVKHLRITQMINRHRIIRAFWARGRSIGTDFGRLG
jgi:hypothetical protein